LRRAEAALDRVDRTDFGGSADFDSASCRSFCSFLLGAYSSFGLSQAAITPLAKPPIAPNVMLSMGLYPNTARLSMKNNQYFTPAVIPTLTSGFFDICLF